MSKSDTMATLPPAAATRLEIFAPSGFPVVAAGDSLSRIILETLRQNHLSLADGDIIVLAQKIVSKAEGRLRDLTTVTASEEAVRLARICDKDERLVELILSESKEVLRCRPGVIIVRHRLGWVLANAGIDHSNVEQNAIESNVLLLPKDPDASASLLRQDLIAQTGATVGVMIIDSFGRAWRLGTIGTCIGSAGIQTLSDLRGHEDLFGIPLKSSILGRGDEIAAAASIMMGQTDEGRPLVVIRGLQDKRPHDDAVKLIRSTQEDLFR